MSGSLAGGQDLRRSLGNFGLQLIKFLLNDLFVIRKVGFQPFESTGVIFGFKILFELIKLLVAHLICQTDTDTHLERFVDVFQETVLLGGRQRGQSDFLKQTVIDFQHRSISLLVIHCSISLTFGSYFLDFSTFRVALL